MLQFHKARLAAVLVIFLIAALIGCSTPANTPTPNPPTNVPATVAIATNTSVPVPTNAPATSAPSTEGSPQPSPTTAAPSTEGSPQPSPTTAATNANETITLVVVPEKSEARYRVREQLAGVSLPSDAVGKTNAVSGQIVGKMDGTIISAESQFVVDVRTLRSDQGLRDNFIQRTPLQTSQYPNVTFVPKSAPGLPLLVPSNGSAAFQLIGDLTIKDVTKPVTWEATCQLESNQTEGKCSATVSFTFADFNLEQPRVGRVVSIEETIKLEIDLYLQRK